MSWIKNMGGLIGYIIGATVILPLLLIGYNYFFINKNDTTEIKSRSQLTIRVVEAVIQATSGKLRRHYLVYEHGKISKKINLTGLDVSPRRLAYFIRIYRGRSKKC